MKRLALRSALSTRASEDAIKVVESFDWAEPKTKSAISLLSSIGVEKKALIVLGRGETVAERSFRNLGDVIISEPREVTTYDVLWAEDVVFSKAALDAMSALSGAFDVTEEDFVKVNEGSEA